MLDWKSENTHTEASTAAPVARLILEGLSTS